MLLDRGFQIEVLTKSRLIVRDFDLFRGRGVRIGISLSTLDDHLRQLWEPGAASVSQRLEVLESARHEGLETSIMFGPLLPFLSDSQTVLDALLRQAADSGVDAIWVDALNPRPRVWPAVAELLRTHFPELLPRYRAILFDARARAEYLAAIHDRIDHAARRAALADRVSACM